MLSLLKAHADPKPHGDFPKFRADPKVPHYDSAPGYYPDY